MNEIYDSFFEKNKDAIFFVDGQAYASESDDAIIIVTRPSDVKDFEIPINIVVKEPNIVASPILVNNYFQDDLCNSRVKNVEGMSGSYLCLGCDYCRTLISGNCYFYCIDCHKDMCNLCKSETNEEIALQNGAKNYASRKDILSLCQNQHRIVERNICFGSDRVCDVCEKNCAKGCYFVPEEENSFDICNECWESNKEKVQTEIESRGGKEVFKQCTISFMQLTRFGSLLDWKPIICDKEYHCILVNINRNSPYCGKFAGMAVDDHGRCGYFLLEKIVTVEELVDKLNEFATDPEWLESKGWANHYNSPIPRLMQLFNCPVHYG